MSEEIPFEPFLFEDPHKQTIFSSLLNFLFDASSDTKIVRMPDGDRLAYEVTTPRNWKPEDPTVLLVHGLCGSHRSPYLIRMVKRLEPEGIRAVRFNMRGCGSGKGLAKNIYHSGRSEDLFEVLKAVKIATPESPIILIGFSLGANIVLKLAGELNALGAHYLKGVIAVSPPADLYSSVQMLGEPENSFYEKYFYKLLRADVHYRHRKFRDLPRVRLPKGLKLYEFDQLYTAPTCGFKSAIDYYDKCSSAHFVEDIAVPTKILFSEDDPIISSKSLDGYNLPSHIRIFKTKKGGHLGYLGSPVSSKGFHWLDSQLMDWITEF